MGAPRVLWHDVVDSTNERAFAALAAGTARHGDLHAARGQTRGRGRRGHAWESPPDEGLYLSLVLLEQSPGQPHPAPVAVTMAAGVALLEAVRAAGLTGARLDWPNDLVVSGAKLAGILTESRGSIPHPHYVVGIGVNVRQRAFPAALTRERAVTSLALEGLDLEPAAFLELLAGPLRRRLAESGTAPGAIARDYLAGTGLLHREVAVAGVVGGEAAGEVRGRLEGLDPASGLRLSLADGSRRDLRLEHVTGLRTLESPE